MSENGSVQLRAVGYALVTCLLVGWSVSAAADQTRLCADDADCLRLIETKQTQTETLSARFEQTKYLSLLTEPLVSRGTFAFRRPDRVLWKVDDPELTILIDSSGLHLPNVPGLEEEAAAMAPFSRMLRELSGLFTGSLGGVRQQFDVHAVAREQGVVLQLRPKSEQLRRMFTSIEVRFEGANLLIASMRLEEALGDRLELNFSDVHRNDDVAERALPTPK